MRAAALGITLLGVLVVGGALSSAAVAGDEIDPIGTVTSVVAPVTSVVSDVTDQTTVVSDLTGTAGGVIQDDESTGAALIGTLPTSSNGGTADSASTSGGDASTADSQSSADRRSKANGSERTRFDRLPRRYEVLLERIEFGHKLRASVARLRALLTSASPELRARILRLIRAELRRLERGGLTGRERAAARRLRHLRSVLVRQFSPETSTGSPSLGGLAGAGVAPADAGATAETSPSGGATRSGTPEPPFTGGPNGPAPGVPELLPPPATPPLDDFNWLWVILSIVLGSLVGVALVVLVASSARWFKGQV